MELVAVFERLSVNDDDLVEKFSRLDLGSQKENEAPEIITRHEIEQSVQTAGLSIRTNGARLYIYRCIDSDELWHTHVPKYICAY